MQTLEKMIVASILLVFLLSGCQSGADLIVGRWEFGTENSGFALEFYGDGTGASYSSLDPFHPLVGVFTYEFDPKSGALEISPVDDPMERTIAYQVSFESENEMSVEQIGFANPFLYVRKPLPALPPSARARIGGMMLGKDFTFIDAEKLKSGLDAEYVAVGAKNIEAAIGKGVDGWLVTLQVEGESSQYVLWQGDGQRWEAVKVIYVPEDVKAAVDAQSPGAIILSAQESTKSINDSLTWCVVYQQKDGSKAGMAVTEDLVITSESETSFNDLGCTNWNK